MSTNGTNKASSPAPPMPMARTRTNPNRNNAGRQGLPSSQVSSQPHSPTQTQDPSQASPPIPKHRATVGRSAGVSRDSMLAFDDMLRDLENINSTNEFDTNSNTNNTDANNASMPRSPRSHSIRSPSLRSNNSSSNAINSTYSANNNTSNNANTFHSMLRDLESVGSMSSTISNTASNAGRPLPTSVAKITSTISIGNQIVKGERERREMDRLEKERAAKAQLALEKEAFLKKEMDERAEKDALRRREDETRRLESDRLRRAKLRRDTELKDSDARNQALAARMTVGGLAFATALRAVNGPSPDEKIIVPDYIDAVIRTLVVDKTIAPMPEDFASYDGFSLWQSHINKPLQEVLADFLHSQFVQPVSANTLPIPVDIFFKVVEAKSLIAKEGRSRDAYCRIEFGAIPQPDYPPKTGVEIFMTETIQGTVNPVWNQHVDVASQELTDSIIVSVWDRRKDDFLGRVVMSVKDIVTSCGASGSDGFVSRWHKLQPRGASVKNKDKYIGGDLLIEMSIDMEKTPLPDELHADPIAQLEAQLVSCKINFKALYITLLRACLILDINSSPPPATQPMNSQAAYELIHLLSPESIATLKFWERKWLIRESFRTLTYLDLVFQKYKLYEVPVWALLNAYEELYGSMKRNPTWLNDYEKPILVDTLEEMHAHYKIQVSNYREYYPKNKPDEALESTILLLRMIFKSPVYRQAHPNLPTSFRTEIKSVMLQAVQGRFKKLQEHSAPFDEHDTEAVIDGLIGLCDLLVAELIADYKYYRKSFEIELDIVRMNAEVYLEKFVGVLSAQLEGGTGLLTGDDVVQKASRSMFALYKKLKSFDAKYCKVCPSIKKSPYYSKFKVEDWFAPFVSKWLEHLTSLTVEWVTNAVKADKFEAMESDTTAEDSLQHSSSITDLFQAVYSNLDNIMDLKWSNELQQAGFIQKFGKTVSRAIENYCDVVGTDDADGADAKGATFSNFIMSVRMQKEESGPADITNESCVKLCNLEYARMKLDEMHSMMNVSTLARTQVDHRATMALNKKTTPSAKAASALDEQDKVKGAFKIELVYAENVKPVTKNGLANPFMVVRMPEGTVVPAQDPSDSSASAKANTSPSVPVILTGNACELVRTRPVFDTINPVWDETFSTLLPPVSHLDVFLYSKNLISSNELCGKTLIDLSGRLSRLRQKLGDHHTHDVYIEFAPQGRGLIRMTLEGEQEDVDYWFRKSRERLKRTQNDLLRALTTRVSPYLRETIVRVIKEHESVALNRGFLQTALGTGSVQYSNQTAAGVAIDKPVTPAEADSAMSPVTEYLNKNLELLCANLSPSMAHEVIKRLWEEVLLDVEYVLIPPLFGQIESSRRYLNKRQVSMCGWALSVLRSFFHADGEALGLAYKILDSRKYLELTTLMSVYFNEVPRIKREYELSTSVNGRPKEMLMRLVRLRAEKQEELTPAERDGLRKWVDVELSRRKER
ncbi:hypothetical protein CcCBS67573_g03877 [Chytriomyces confervae]|uniref:Uncharacterized protein n=1 Tax=Chytriomyces confervae TaxID=246404 RepID=A0A507FIF8_9FUNG|nr:hypothetical protein CcCBS67573_g03877 [Chytriomyces confervae]